MTDREALRVLSAAAREARDAHPDEQVVAAFVEVRRDAA